MDSLHNEEMDIIFSRICVRGAKFILLIDLSRGTQETHPSSSRIAEAGSFSITALSAWCCLSLSEQEAVFAISEIMGIPRLGYGNSLFENRPGFPVFL